MIKTTQCMVSMLRRFYTKMYNNNSPHLGAIIPLITDYERLRLQILDDTDLPFSMKDFGDFIMTLLGGLIAPYKWDISATELFLQMYFSPAEANSQLRYYTSLIAGYLNHFGIPVIPAYGYTHQYYMRTDGNLYIHYQIISLPVTSVMFETRDAVLEAIENGDYVDERTKCQFGIN